jgi:tetratricopeptide (TPR) repeat protein
MLAIVAVAVVAALALTMSRSAWLAACCAGLVLLAGWWWGRSRVGAAVTLGIVVAAAGAGGLAYQLHWLPESVGSSLAERLHRLDDSAGRPAVWRTGLRIYRDHPVTGSGLDTFRLAFGSERRVEAWDENGDGTPTRAHNEVIHILATQGTLGGIALLALFAGLVWATVRAWRQTTDRPLVAAVAASLTAFIVTSMFGFSVIATGSLFVIFAGLLARWSAPSVAEGETTSAAGTWRPWWTTGVGVAAVAVAFVGVLQPLMANLACRRGDAELAADSPRAIAEYRQATNLDPDCALYWTRLADAAQREARRTGSLDDTKQARAALERAAALVPADAYLHVNLGRLLAEMSLTDRSLAGTCSESLRRALDLDPNNSCLLSESARSALAVGDYDSARQWAERGAELYPTRAVFHAQLGAAALAQGNLPEAAGELEQSLKADWRCDAEGLSRALATLAATLLRQHDFVRAQEFAGKASVWFPQWPTPHMLRGQALQALGRRDEATKEFRTASELSGVPRVN